MAEFHVFLCDRICSLFSISIWYKPRSQRSQEPRYKIKKDISFLILLRNNKEKSKYPGMGCKHLWYWEIMLKHHIVPYIYKMFSRMGCKYMEFWWWLVCFWCDLLMFSFGFWKMWWFSNKAMKSHSFAHADCCCTDFVNSFEKSQLGTQNRCNSRQWKIIFPNIGCYSHHNWVDSLPFMFHSHKTKDHKCLNCLKVFHSSSVWPTVPLFRGEVVCWIIFLCFLSTDRSGGQGSL